MSSPKPLLMRAAFALLCCLSLPTAAHAQTVEVLASVRPLALIARAVVVDPAQVRQLVPDGVSSHDYALRPSDRRALALADIVLRIGPAHDAFLNRALSGRTGITVEAQSLTGMTLLRQRQRDGSANPGAAVDAHVWLHPGNAAVIAQALAGVLAEADPAHAADYRRNARQFAQRLEALGQRLGKPASPGGRPYVAYHDAYQYLEPSLGLRYRGSLTLDAESKPGARHFQLMVERIRTERISCLLAEPGFDKALAERVAGGRALRMESVDEMFTLAPSDATGYERGLAQMASEILRCTGGS